MLSIVESKFHFKLMKVPHKRSQSNLAIEPLKPYHNLQEIISENQ